MLKSMLSRGFVFSKCPRALTWLNLLLLQAEKPMEGFDPANVERVVRNVDNFSIWQVLLPLLYVISIFPANVERVV
jgi:hypothetical protein